ncbi:major facilitator superfamily domain-containing protein 12-like [Rhopilema esculentum]|uniref:major facilitator superfamily domain-containing protein 12-like n=1 Tax=Rhopilema esculentum TaxID=499914 RepID=UPI0031DE6C17
MPAKLFQKICGHGRNPGDSGGSSRRLPLIQRVCYGVGHVFNDLCANCWFSYLLIYMTKVISLSNANAGLILLIGQVADAIFTPFIGYGCDKTNCKYYGRRKLWHLIGTFCVLLSFPFIFNKCISCENASSTTLVLYYAAFVVVFQFGWAAVQISHLSLIPEIANKVSEKVGLNAIRSGLTFVCGIYVFGATWFLLGTNPEENVTGNVAPQFMYLSFIVVATGILFSAIFHVGTIEPKHYVCRKKPVSQGDAKDNLLHSPISSNDCEILQSDITTVAASSTVDSAEEADVIDSNDLLADTNLNSEETCRQWIDWLKTPFFYKMALIYMCTRLTLNVSSSYFVLYLTETMAFEKEAIAYFPLLVLVSGVISSGLTKVLTKRVGGRLTFIVGCIAALGSFVWLFMVSKDARASVYVAALLMGCGCSIMLVTSLAMTADLIGTNKGSCAFVYSAMSFTDKLSSGIVIYIIQQLKPVNESGEFTRYVQTTVTGASCLAALVCVIFFFPADFTWKKKVFLQESGTQTEADSDASDLKKGVSHSSLDDGQGIHLVQSEQNEENIIQEMDAPGSSLDEKLKRLSWHSSMTSYIAWRLASPHVPSPTGSPSLDKKSCQDSSPDEVL